VAKWDVLAMNGAYSGMPDNRRQAASAPFLKKARKPTLRREKPPGIKTATGISEPDITRGNTGHPNRVFPDFKLA
jgi:hypothetical protein